MDVFVTGGAGFIGSHVCERLLRDGHVVRILDDLATRSMASVPIIIERLFNTVGPSQTGRYGLANTLKMFKRGVMRAGILPMLKRYRYYTPTPPVQARWTPISADMSQLAHSILRDSRSSNNVSANDLGYRVQ